MELSSLRDFIRDALIQADHLLLALCIAANLMGIALIYSATRYDSSLHSYPIKQAIAMGIGIVLFFLLSQLDIDMLMSKWIWVLAGSLLLIALLAVPGVGHSVGGNRSWIAFPLFSIQPAEIVKLTFSMLLARQIVRLQQRRGLSHPCSVGLLCAHLLLFVGLIYAVSSDAGSALVYVFIFAVMLWAAGLKLHWFLLGGSVLLLAGCALWMALPEDNYWKMRILVCFDHDLDPTNRGFQQTRSLLAIQSGKLQGMGYLNGNLTQASYQSALPARHTDFIFSACCEELGLIGASILLLLLAAIICRCFYIGIHASTPFYSLVAIGYGGMFLFQVVLNVGMCLYVLPVVGLTLPFISYGGSSLITAYAAMGILSGIRQRGRPRWLQEQAKDVWEAEE